MTIRCYLQRRVVTGPQEFGAHNHVGLGVGVEGLDVVEDLGSTLTSTDDGNSIRGILVGENSRDVVGELG